MNKPSILFQQNEAMERILLETKASLDSPKYEVKWMPEYGCLWFFEDCKDLISKVSISLIGLDQYKFMMHATGTNYKHIAEPDLFRSVHLHVGILMKDDIEDYLSRFREIFEEAVSRKGFQRSAAFNEQGHQKTPAFIHATLTQAYSFSTVVHRPQGGFTDVGQHTGGIPCNTCWALACSLLHFSLNKNVTNPDDSMFTFRVLMAYMDIYTMDTCFLQENFKKLPLQLDGICSIMKPATHKTAQLAYDGYDVSSMYEDIKQGKEKLEKLALELENKDSSKFKLPEMDKSYIQKYEFCDPILKLSEQLCHSERMNNVGLMKDSLKYLNHISLFDKAKGSNNHLETLWEWLEKLKKSKKNGAQQIQLNEIESTIWQYAKRLREIPLSESEIKTLVRVLDRYRDILNELRLSKQCNKVMVVEMNSYEVLVLWVVYCLTFQSTRKIYGDIMNKFGVCLNYEDLKYLVLSNKQAIDTASLIVQFLADMSKINPIFHLDNHAPTFDMAQKYGEHFFTDLWIEERENATKREENYWAEVTRKKNLASNLRDEINDLESRMLEARKNQKQAKNKLQICKTNHSIYCAESSHNSLQCIRHWENESAQVDACDAAVQDLESSIDGKKKALSIALKAPNPIIQPLPRNKNMAMRVLFFLHMPDLFKHLSRISMTSAQSLIPRVSDIYTADGNKSESNTLEKIRIHESQSSWLDHYNTYYSSQYYRPPRQNKANTGHLLLRMSKFYDKVPNQFGPSNVDNIFHVSDGEWYPDTLKLRLSWTGGPKRYDQYEQHEFNPFVRENDWITSSFTESLPIQDKPKLQWSLIQNGHADKLRGNKPITDQINKPKWLKKQEYLWFGKIRAYPHVQLRNILLAFLERSLPFGALSVHTLFRQAIYHVGKVSVIDNTINFDWKEDMQCTEFLSNMKNVMDGIIDEIKSSPFEYNTAYLMAELAGFFSQWSFEFTTISRDIIFAVLDWVDDMNKEAHKISPSEARKMKIRQAMFCNLVTFASLQGNTTKYDISTAVEYNCRARNTIIDDKNDMKKDFLNIETSCQRVMLEKSALIFRTVREDTKILTSALKHVVSNIPTTMKWKCDEMILRDAACFSSFADSGDGQVRYDINIINGVVLVDGLPPGALPLAVLDHPTYKRTFGDANFEVCQKRGFHETRYHVNESLYQFGVVSDQLYAREISKEGFELDLLDFDQVQKWAGDLPEQLQQLYGHWWNKKEGLIFLQGIKYEDRSVDYILVLDQPIGTNAKDSFKCQCKQVPKHMRHMNRSILAKKLESFDRLVLHESPIIDILSKFESRRFIHIIQTQTGNKLALNAVKFYLPRYGLNFFVNKSELWCSEIVDYKLCRMQQTRKISRRFNSYLLLEEGYKKFGCPKLILVPEGRIKRNFDNLVTVETRDDNQNSSQKWSKFEIHPRFDHIVAAQISDRIRLASLLLASTFSLQILDTQLNGEERAIELLRQCWKNTPLSTTERNQLENLKEICHGFSPAVSLLCYDLEQNSLALHDPSHSPNIDNDEVSAYLHSIEFKQCGVRHQLSPYEELRVIGATSCYKCQRGALLPSYDAKECPHGIQELEKIQKSLNFKQMNDNEKSIENKFPLDHIQTNNRLEAEMLGELSKSWASYQASKCSPSMNILTTKFLRQAKGKVNKTRRDLQQCVFDHLEWTPEFCHDRRGLEVKLLRLIDIHPSALLTDLVLFACEKRKVKSFNPFLTEAGIENIQTIIIRWLQYCVMEDKIERLLYHCDNRNNNNMNWLNELRNQRKWSDYQRPHWLAFEVEGQIQIRSEQFVIANHLLKNPGDIVQLNMGMGKTRVILPMLILELHFGLRDKVMRLHILSSLFEEAFQFMHSTCCASMLNIKLFKLPFSREVALDIIRVNTIKMMISQCQREGGIFLVEPEHRLSLELKTKLLGIQKSPLADDLNDIIYDTPWYNIHDESDEILHHRFQLIYAHGGVMSLPEGFHRFNAAETLLEVLQKEKIDIVMKENGLNQVKFPTIIISSETTIDQISLEKFRQQIFSALLKHLPYKLKWMYDHPKIDDIIQCVTKEKYDITFDDFPKEHKNDILALRGLLAGDLLFHCLLKRHRVNYGIARPGKKRIAIPFRSADIPSMRSEFAHPDIAITLTLLSYYYDGLSLSEIEEAFCELLSLGKGKTKYCYHSWFELSSSYMEPSVSSSLNKVEKIDLSNKSQIKLLHEHFGMNPKTINFWLNNCVFPTELQQYPYRLMATAWHLTNSNCGPTIGFSGTNDNHRILPLQVKQYFSKNTNPIWQQIQGTNGKMIDLILKKTIRCENLNLAFRLEHFTKHTVEKKRPKNSLLMFVKENITAVQAIIDCGALLAGIDNLNVAKHIIELADENIVKGVCFFHKCNGVGQWMILDRSGRLLPKYQSPINERETFVVFDEARCRGADIKLKGDATAVLTIGPKLCKDKLMQGAGRLRQLSFNQRLIIVGLDNVFKEVEKETCGKDTINILEWTFKNTFRATIEGITNWASQGMHFGTTEKNIESILIKEKLGLHEFYGRSFESETIVDQVKKIVKEAFNRVGGSNALSLTLSEQMIDRVKLLDTFKVSSRHGADEQCEREMELDREMEMEMQKEIPQMTPRVERGWNWKQVITASSPSDLPTEIYSLQSFVEKNLQPSNLRFLNFSKKVYLSRNFVISVHEQISSYNEYLRIVDPIVIFPNGQCILVSERESEFILCEFRNHYKNKKGTVGNIFTHVPLLRNHMDSNKYFNIRKALLLELNSGLTLNIDDHEVASIQLLSGETSYKTKRRQDVLHSMFMKALNSNGILMVDPREFPYMRGYQMNVEYSDLERIWKDVIRQGSVIRIENRLKAKAEADAIF